MTNNKLITRDLQLSLRDKERVLRGVRDNPSGFYKDMSSLLPNIQRASTI